MTAPNHGSIGTTFIVTRGFQFISMICIIGMTANFVAEMVNADQKPQPLIVGTLTITVLMTLYTALTVLLYMDSHLSFLIAAAMDAVLLIPIITITVLVGKPLSYLDCPALPDSGTTSAFITSVGKNVGKVNYWVWAGASKTTCFEMKAIWGLCICLCVFFACSAVLGGFIWKIEKGAAASGPAKDFEEV